MKNKLVLIVALISLGSISLPAQSTVNFTAAPGQRDVLATDATALDNGNYVAIGYFDAGFDLLSFSSDLLALASAWNEYGSTTVQTVFGQPGRFAGTDSNIDPAFDGQTIYLWIVQTSDASAPAGNYSNVTGYGIYTSSSANWLFPSQGSLFPANMTSVNSSEIDAAMYGSYDANHLYLQPIPEPGTIMLMVLGGVALLAWRMRQFHS